MYSSHYLIGKHHTVEHTQNSTSQLLQTRCYCTRQRHAHFVSASNSATQPASRQTISSRFLRLSCQPDPDLDKSNIWLTLRKRTQNLITLIDEKTSQLREKAKTQQVRQSNRVVGERTSERKTDQKRNTSATVYSAPRRHIVILTMVPYLAKTPAQ